VVQLAWSAINLPRIVRAFMFAFAACFSTCMKSKGFDTGLGSTVVPRR
jgi:hypothetical protein